MVCIFFNSTPAVLIRRVMLFFFVYLYITFLFFFISFFNVDLQMVPKKSLLDEMKLEAEEMFGDEAGLDIEEEGEERDYDEEDRDDEQEENHDMDDMDEDEHDTPKKSKGMRRILNKRKLPTETTDNDDDDDDFVSSLSISSFVYPFAHSLASFSLLSASSSILSVNTRHHFWNQN